MDFWCILEGFWAPNLHFFRYFALSCFGLIFGSIFFRFFVGFGGLGTLKIAISPRREHDFYKIDVFEKIVKKHGFWLRFRRPKRRKIYKKLCWKTCVFLISFFSCFFAIFSDFAWILGGPGPSKNWKKIEKIDFPTRSVLKEGSGRVLGRFWGGFGRILKGFWTDSNGILGIFFWSFFKGLGRINND